LIADILDRLKGKRRWEELAKELGVTRMTLYNVRNGKTEPGDKLLTALGLERKQRIVRKQAAA